MFGIFLSFSASTHPCTATRNTVVSPTEIPLRNSLRNILSIFFHILLCAATLLEEMQSTYDPFQVEHLWDGWWEQRGYYRARTNSEKDDSKQENFVMVIPPPNVTGSLHLGHALMATIEDTITRYWRMKGKNCLWLPGTDHAGIATQSVVERQLARKGLTRHDLGAFLMMIIFSESVSMYISEEIAS